MSDTEDDVADNTTAEDWSDAHLTASADSQEPRLDRIHEGMEGVLETSYLVQDYLETPLGTASYEPELQTPRVNHYPIPKRIDFSHKEGKGVGTRLGYTKLDVILGPEYEVGHFLPLADIRGVVFDDGTYAASAGFIGRFLPTSFCEAFGFNLIYYFRHERFGNYNQLGGGFEVLNKRWEVHANAYIPVGRKDHPRKFVFDDYIGDFRATLTEHRQAAYAFDATAGYYLVNGKNFQLYAAAGTYYLFAKHDVSAWGVEGMIRPQYADYLAVELSISHDRIFETIYQVNVVFTIPLYDYSSAIKKKRGPCGLPNRQIYQPIDLDENIILESKCCWKANFD